MRVLCRVDDLPDGDARGFPAPPGGFTGLFAVRQGDRVHVYRNACPHLGVSLDQRPGRFLTADRSRIRCMAHGAEFRIVNGECLLGPCLGGKLEAVAALVQDGAVLVPDQAGL